MLLDRSDPQKMIRSAPALIKVPQPVMLQEAPVSSGELGKHAGPGKNEETKHGKTGCRTKRAEKTNKRVICVLFLLLQQTGVFVFSVSTSDCFGSCFNELVFVLFPSLLFGGVGVPQKRRSHWVRCSYIKKVAQRETAAKVIC